MARIRVGAATEVELKDKKLRYEDAVNSVKNALKFGVLPGGCLMWWWVVGGGLLLSFLVRRRLSWLIGRSISRSTDPRGQP